MSVPRKPDCQHLLIENVPRDLVDDFKRRCRDEAPGTTLRSKLIALMRDWIDNTRD